jgi:[acyl-carrier-protein] S-malonyltransferase
MAKCVYDEFSREIADKANEILGYDLSEIMFCGPAEILNKTQYCQPAILTANVMIWDAFVRRNGVVPSCVAGHSVGEYAAFVASGAMSFEVALHLIKIRAEAMDKASPKDASGEPAGAMCAILGADKDVVARAIREYFDEEGSVNTGGEDGQGQGGEDKRCSIANYNCPGQVVITGLYEDVVAVREVAIGLGAKKGIMLPVSGPFHSKWMQTAAEHLRRAASSVQIFVPKIPIISNVTARPILTPEEIRGLIPIQVTSPVLWEDSIATMVDMGVCTFIEIGNGNVLTGISKRCAPSMSFISVQNPLGAPVSLS